MKQGERERDARNIMKEGKKKGFQIDEQSQVIAMVDFQSQWLIDTTLVKNGDAHQKVNLEPFFCHHTTNSTLFTIIYVDEIFIMGLDQECIDILIQSLTVEFKVYNLCPTH